MLKKFMVKMHPMQSLLNRQHTCCSGKINTLVSYTMLLVFLLAGIYENVRAQTIYDVNFQPVVFKAANRVQKIGNGQAAGDKVLYTNAVTVGGQVFDCIVTTVSISGGSFQLPGSASSGTIPHDFNGTGTGLSAAVDDNFFAPTFSWGSSGGNCLFEYQFIMGGSYNNTTNTGANVYMTDVYLNTYDIDGNGGSNSNQFTEFGGFITSQYGNNIAATYNGTTGLTKFRSTTTSNSATITADAHRIRVSYGIYSKISVSVGADGSGSAYYFLDFSVGPAWTTPPPVNSAPILDLNTTTAGLNNVSANYCSGLAKYTEGATNITEAVSVDVITITVPQAQIPNGNNELLVYNQASPSASNIAWGFTSASSSNVTIGGIGVTVARSLGSGNKVLKLSKTTGTFTAAEAETVLDALYYGNTAATKTQGVRNFTVKDKRELVEASKPYVAVQFLLRRFLYCDSV